ncbi:MULTISPECIES: dihydrofolate reductase family protein [unclassified Frigoribacterium]|uniref:dihydrofolate reductase family protein n=1 Tax=unclassified Frigoribacterium TaxID=2627005 RepID=UPI0006F85AFB|nr:MULTISPECIES: dihydrofolate reductase family protein [unclassified Frigoribacterium]KQN39169.1 deaminase [Frigoribacterium sp. Leaf44]
MRTLTYSINVTLDGCIDHREGRPDAEVHQLATEALAQADGLLLGRVTYELMEQSWRPPASDGFPDWMQPFARTIHDIPKYVASTTLESVDWNAELLGGDVREAVRELKSRPGGPLRLGGSTFATDVVGWGLVDEYEFTVYPWVAGHGPHLLAGLPHPLDLTPTARHDLASGAVATTYEPRA